MPEDIMDCRFAAHHEVAAYQTMSDRIGTMGFELGLAQTVAIRQALMPCDSVGKELLVPFRWYDRQTLAFVSNIMNKLCHTSNMLSNS